MKTIKYYIYRLKWFLAQYYDFGRPIHVDIELTNKCNQRCISCWHSKPDELPFEIYSMPLGQAKRYLRQARELGCLSVKFNLRGEPLLYPHLPELVLYAKQLGFIDTMLNTNLAVNNKTVRRLVQSGVDTIIVSVDSFNQDVYNKIHGTSIVSGDFIKMITNLMYLSRMRKSGFLKTRVKLNFHINKVNKGKEGYDYWRDNFAHFPIVERNTMKREGEDITLNGVTPKGGRSRKKRCPHMWRRITILSNGKVYPCCVCYNEPKDIMLNSLDFKMGCMDYGLIGYFQSRKQDILKTNYRQGVYEQSCWECSSGDIWK